MIDNWYTMSLGKIWRPLQVSWGLHCFAAVVWSETVGFRTKPVSHQKISLDVGLGLAGLMLCCETRSCYARRRNDLEGHSNFSSTVSLFCVWNITKGKCKGPYTWYSASSYWITTAEALRYGTCSRGISQFYLHTHTFIRNRNEPYLPLLLLWRLTVAFTYLKS